MQSAFGLRKARPTAGTGIFPNCHWPRARRTSDARIALVMQGIVRKFVLTDVVPHHVAGPIAKRVDLNQAEFCVPLDFLSLRAVGRLIASDRGNPGSKSG